MGLTCLLFLTVLLGVKGLSTPQEDAEDFAFETCLYPNGQFYTGLRPVHSSTPVNPPRPCELFWHCRAKLNSTPEERVEPTRFNCSDANPSKPYYDASQCRCVSTSDHCDSNDEIANQYKCLRPFNANEYVESCRGFGTNAPYYTNLFANHDDLGKFWSCIANPWGPPLPAAMQCPDDLIFDARHCFCNHKINNVEEIRKFNTHPMNRFNCSTTLRTVSLRT